MSTGSSTVRAAEAAAKHARADTADYPQYDGHFDDWVPVRVTRRITTKMGVAFSAGEVTIAHPDTEPGGRWSRHDRTRTVWSVKNGIQTEVPAEAVEEL